MAVVERTAKPATSAVPSTEVAGSRAPAAPEGAPLRHTVAPLARLQPRETALVIQVLSSQSRQDDPDARSLPELRSSRARKRKGWPVTTSRANWSHLQSEWAQLE